MNFAAFTPRDWVNCLLGSCIMLSCSTSAWSADTAAASALKVLLGPQAAFQQIGGMPPTPAHSAEGAMLTKDSATSPASASSAMVNGTVTVKRGETLDRVIRRALPDVPLHPDFLRKAFVSLNPQVFPSGSPHQMRSGASLKVPSMPALRQMMMNDYPGAAPLLHETEGQMGQKAAADPNDQRRWVRYP
jgi:Tfp pilus assembly protein FimV